MSKTVTEINRLNKAVNEFQEEMKTVLAEKAARGKTGWDTMSSDSLFSLLKRKINMEGTTTIELMQKESIDIANLAMFYRIALQEGR